MTTCTITIPVGEESLPAALSRSSGDGRSVVIMPSIFGVGADLIEQMEELAEHAVTVVAWTPSSIGPRRWCVLCACQLMQPRR
jgi:dienelactone hydrolase